MRSVWYELIISDVLVWLLCQLKYEEEGLSETKVTDLTELYNGKDLDFVTYKKTKQ